MLECLGGVRERGRDLDLGDLVLDLCFDESLNGSKDLERDLFRDLGPDLDLERFSGSLLGEIDREVACLLPGEELLLGV